MRVRNHVIFARGAPRIRIILQSAWHDFLFWLSERQTKTRERKRQMNTLPTLTTEQRRDNLERAKAARRARASFAAI